MTDIDLPLSDIINKKKITLNRYKPSANIVSKAATTMATTVKPKIIRPTSDARNHLIQKKRLHMTDARDQLVKIAQTSDARDKLNKIRNKPRQQQGGIPELMKELQSKPMDMRQKLNLQRNSTLQVKKNYNNVQQAKPALQTANKAGTGMTRMQGNAIVRTVSGNTASTTAGPPRRTIQNVRGAGQNRSITNTIQNRSVNLVRGVSNNSINIQRNRLGNKGISGSVIQQFHRNNAVRVARHPVAAPTLVTVRNTAPTTQVIRSARPMQRLARRTVPAVAGGAVYATRPRQAVVQPQTVYRQVSSRPGTVVVQEEPQQSVVYQEEPELVYEEEPLEYDEYDMMPAEPQPLFYDDDNVSPAYEPEFEEVYVSRAAPTQQHYGPPIPPQSRSAVYTQSSGNLVSRTPRLQQQPQVSYAAQPQQQQQQYRNQQQQQQRFPQQQQQRFAQQQQRFPQQQQQQQRFTQQQQQQQRFTQQQQPRYTQQQRSQPQQRTVQQSPRSRVFPIIDTVCSPCSRPVAVRSVPVAAVPKVVGHRIVVSNLHPVATNEDIEELFGNIGSISSCKMTRPGTASVVFDNLSDAQKSVEVYHNRKLDGQPMQVKIVGTVTESNSMGASSRSVRGRMY
ncbi:RNA recognition motif domain [Trinorchestia longiramus]|nr:RNA recognition motif domain [Trinorchestia longiramus]